MPFVFVQIRPVGDKRGSWYVRRSDQAHDNTYRDFAVAQLSVMNSARNSDLSMLVLVHNHLDQPEQAYAAKDGSWRDLHLIVKHGPATILNVGNHPRHSE